jgi:hypothetical protein
LNDNGIELLDDTDLDTVAGGDDNGGWIPGTPVDDGAWLVDQH